MNFHHSKLINENDQNLCEFLNVFKFFEHSEIKKF
jgi:hypothetical protein